MPRCMPHSTTIRYLFILGVWVRSNTTRTLKRKKKKKTENVYITYGYTIYTLYEVISDTQISAHYLYIIPYGYIRTLDVSRGVKQKKNSNFIYIRRWEKKLSKIFEKVIARVYTHNIIVRRVYNIMMMVWYTLYSLYRWIYIRIDVCTSYILM